MTRLALIVLAFLAVAIVAARCDPPARAQTGPANYSRISNSSPAQPITPTATVALPTATDWPTLTPDPTEAPRCSVTVYWQVAAGRAANLYQRPAGTFGPWDWFLSVNGDFPATGIPLDSINDVLAVIPGPTNTPWNTPEPATETPTPAPTQTARIVVVVVTATPEPTGTAPPTATARPLSPVLLPVVVRPRVRR